jgi:hypothetical protein
MNVVVLPTSLKARPSPGRALGWLVSLVLFVSIVAAVVFEAYEDLHNASGRNITADGAYGVVWVIIMLLYSVPILYLSYTRSVQLVFSRRM